MTGAIDLTDSINRFERNTHIKMFFASEDDNEMPKLYLSSNWKLDWDSTPIEFRVCVNQFKSALKEDAWVPTMESTFDSVPTVYPEETPRIWRLYCFLLGPKPRTSHHWALCLNQESTQRSPAEQRHLVLPAHTRRCNHCCGQKQTPCSSLSFRL